MAKFELKLPKMGESVAEATITNWLKNVGDSISADEAVLEIATDKVDSEVPSEVSGVLAEILFQVNDVVKVGQTIAIIETEGGAVTESVVANEVPEEAVAIETAVDRILAKGHRTADLAQALQAGAGIHCEAVLGARAHQALAQAPLRLRCPIGARPYPVPALTEVCTRHVRNISTSG